MKEILNKSLKISEQTYKKLEDYKIVPEETFNSVIKKLIKGELNEGKTSISNGNN
jgi:predicted CopG family antitoxin